MTEFENHSQPPAETAQTVFVGDEKFKLTLPHARIQERIKEIAHEIEKDYINRQPVFIGVLNGSFIFLADLVRQIQNIDLEVDFFKVSSYAGSKSSSGQVQLRKAVDATLKDRDVIIVEDIVDTGLSLTYIRSAILELAPRSLRICTLLYKEEVARIDFTLDYVGFRIPKQFVIGYGLDYRQIKRNLNGIYSLAEE
ncbi:MAG: hypoxanthine phosphoribosyltransferase [Chlorobiales bacterium]|nr:hypoxanthine phosphoribosyltransferase [Chlorobiales bacterium]